MANTNITRTNTNTVPTAGSLQALFMAYPNASIRKLSAAAGINYGIMLKLSKKPIPGEAFDPEAINWTALEEKLKSKNVDWMTLDWDAMNEGPNRKGATLVKDVDAFKVGDEVYLRKNNEVPYVIVYKTATHVVVQLKGSTEPQAWANNTFLLYGPSKEPRAVKSNKEEVEEA